MKHLAITVRQMLTVRLTVLLLLGAVPAVPALALTTTSERGPLATATAQDGATLTPSAKSIGMGGGGAVFDPVISPYDHNTMLADCDMGGMYVTHDAGKHWEVISVGGVVWDIEPDPSTVGTFYAGGSGLWRSTNNGDDWQLIWPNPSAITREISMLNHNRTYYVSSDSYPDRSAVEDIAVDPHDPNHLAVLVSQSATGKGVAQLFESLDGGSTFTQVSEVEQNKLITYKNYENDRVFIEHGSSSATSRLVFCQPDGIYEVDRSKPAASSATPLYVPDASDPEAFLSWVEQVVDAAGTHYVVIEHVNDVTAAALKTHERLWHTTDFADPSKRVDLTDEMVNSLPRHYCSTIERTGGEERVITMHNINMLRAPSLDLMYIAYRTYDAYSVPENKQVNESWQGISGVVTYDASRPSGDRFFWTYGHRAMWSGVDINKRISPDANGLMERGHVDANYTMLGIGVDPRDPQRILLATHTGIFYSPNITADVGMWNASRGLSKVNLFPRYTTTVGKSSFADPALNAVSQPNLNEYLMRSTGIEVTQAYGVYVDPFNTQHLMIAMDDNGCAHSYDGGETWARFYTKLPAGVSDTLHTAVFDPRTEGLVYGCWHASGGSMAAPKDGYLTGTGAFCVSHDGGESWSKSGVGAGLPSNLTVSRMVLVCPQDANGAYTTGDSTIYLACMGTGFYVSHDSGKTFSPMNAGIPAVNASGTALERAIWASDVLYTSDGRLFGMTCYSSYGPQDAKGSSTGYLTQDPATYGNVWEWDEAAGTWVRLPFNSQVTDASLKSAELPRPQVRMPRAFAYDAKTRTLWVAGVKVIGEWADGNFVNFGGGLYTYRSAAGSAVGSGVVAPVDYESPVLGDQRSLTGVAYDEEGTLWLATEDGDVYVSDAQFNDGAWTQVYQNALRLCKSFNPGPGHTMFLTTHGVCALQLGVTLTPASTQDETVAVLTPHEPAPPASPSSAATPATPSAPSSPLTADAPATPDAAIAPHTAEVPASSTTPDAPASPGSPTTADAPITPLQPLEEGWLCDQGVWTYQRTDGTLATGWLCDNGTWYLFDDAGELVSGWAWDAGNWFYLEERHNGAFGSMRTGWHFWAGGWYWLNPDPNRMLRGAMARSAWVHDREKWYLVDADGRMATGWQFLDGWWWYLGADGVLWTQTYTPDGCYVDSSGRWVA